MKLKGKSIEVYICKNCNEIVLPEDMDGECSDCGFFDTLVLTKLSLGNLEREKNGKIGKN